MRELRFLVIVAIIGLTAVHPGDTIKCYVCSGKECEPLNEKVLQTCKAPTPTEPTPSEKPTESTPSEGPTEPTPSEGSTEPTPSEGSTEPTPSEGSTEPTPSEGSTEPTPSEGSTEPTPSEGSTASSTPSEGSTASSTPSEGSTASSTPSEGSTASSKPSEGSTASSKPSEGSTASSKPSEGSTASSKPSEGSTASSIPSVKPDGARKRRSVLDRFGLGKPFAGKENWKCYVKNEGEDTVERGCTNAENFCKDQSKCRVCGTDECNPATSNVMFASLIFSSVLLLIFTK